MSTPGGRKKTSWNDLSPWEKAAQWHEAAPHIADKVMALAEESTKQELALEKSREDHRQKMELRLWWIQLLMVFIGLVNIVVLAIVAWHYADTGNVVPGLTVLGAGASLTAGVYGVGRMIGRRSTAVR